MSVTGMEPGSTEQSLEEKVVLKAEQEAKRVEMVRGELRIIPTPKGPGDLMIANLCPDGRATVIAMTFEEARYAARELFTYSAMDPALKMRPLTQKDLGPKPICDGCNNEEPPRLSSSDEAGLDVYPCDG